LKPEFCLKQSEINMQENFHVCSGSCHLCNFVKNTSAFTEINEKMLTHELVEMSGKHNFEGCRIPINNKINTLYKYSL
jgi:hypothetical protein